MWILQNNLVVYLPSSCCFSISIMCSVDPSIYSYGSSTIIMWILHHDPEDPPPYSSGSSIIIMWILHHNSVDVQHNPVDPLNFCYTQQCHLPIKATLKSIITQFQTSQSSVYLSLPSGVCQLLNDSSATKYPRTTYSAAAIDDNGFLSLLRFGGLGQGLSCNVLSNYFLIFVSKLYCKLQFTT